MTPHEERLKELESKENKSPEEVTELTGVREYLASLEVKSDFGPSEKPVVSSKKLEKKKK